MTHSAWHHKRISSFGDRGGAEGLSIFVGESGCSSGGGADGVGDGSTSVGLQGLQDIFNCKWINKNFV